MDQPEKTTTPTPGTATPIATQPIKVEPLRDLKGVDLRRAPDVRGWQVRLNDGIAIGTVEKLFVDTTAAHELRYLEVRVEPSPSMPNVSAEWHLLVPVGRAQLDAKDDIILLPTLGRNSIADMPKLPHDKPSREFEITLARWFGSKQPADQQGGLYSGDVFDLNYFTAKRLGTTPTPKH